MVSKKIPFENLNNVRDLGGMVTEDGRHVKEGMLLRSGRLFEASDADKKRLAEMVDLILDFRSNDEVDKTPDPQLDGVIPDGDPALFDGEHISRRTSFGFPHAGAGLFRRSGGTGPQSRIPPAGTGSR